MDKPDEKLDALLLQDANVSDIIFRGCAVFSSPSITSKRPGQLTNPLGKAVIYVRSDWPRHQVDLTPYCDQDQEVVAVLTSVRNRTPSACPSTIDPYEEKSTITSGSRTYKTYPRDQKLHAGDFNLHHRACCYDLTYESTEELLCRLTSYISSIKKEPKPGWEVSGRN